MSGQLLDTYFVKTVNQKQYSVYQTLRRNVGNTAYEFGTAGWLDVANTWSAVNTFQAPTSGKSAVFKAAVTTPGNIVEYQSSSSTQLSYVNSVGAFVAPDGDFGTPGFGFKGNTDCGIFNQSGQLTLSPSTSSNIVYCSANSATIQFHVIPTQAGGDGVLKIGTIAAGPTNYAWRITAKNSTTSLQISDNTFVNQIEVLASAGISFPNTSSTVPISFNYTGGIRGTNDTQIYQSSTGPALTIVPKSASGTLDFVSTRFTSQGIRVRTNDGAAYAGTGMMIQYAANSAGYTSIEFDNDTGGRLNFYSHDQGSTYGQMQVSSTGFLFSLTPTSTAAATFQAPTSGKAAVFKAAATTPDNITEWQNSSGTALASIGSGGLATFPNSLYMGGDSTPSIIYAQNSLNVQFRSGSSSGYYDIGRNSSTGYFVFTGSQAPQYTGIVINGLLNITPGVWTSGSPTGLLFTGGAHTTLAASTEAIDVNFNLARTVQFTSGALTTQRAVVFQAPTYSFTGASTLTTTATVAISGAPVAGTNATITNSYALWTQGGLSNLSNVVIGPYPGGSYYGIWFNQTTPSATNYSFLSDGSTGTYIGDGTQLIFSIFNTALMNISPYHIVMGSPITSSSGQSNTMLNVLCPASIYRGIVIRGYSGQSANLQEWQKSDGTVIGAVASDGTISSGNPTSGDPGGVKIWQGAGSLYVELRQSANKSGLNRSGNYFLYYDTGNGDTVLNNIFGSTSGLSFQYLGTEIARYTLSTCSFSGDVCIGGASDTAKLNIKSGGDNFLNCYSGSILLMELRAAGQFILDGTGINSLCLNSAGTNFGTIQNDAADTWSLGTASSATSLGTPILQWTKNGAVIIQSAVDSAIPLTVKAHSGTQSTDLQQWQDSSGNPFVAASIEPDNTAINQGILKLGGSAGGSGNSHGGAIQFYNNHVDTGTLVAGITPIFQGAGVNVGLQIWLHDDTTYALRYTFPSSGDVSFGTSNGTSDGSLSIYKSLYNSTTTVLILGNPTTGNSQTQIVFRDYGQNNISAVRSIFDGTPGHGGISFYTTPSGGSLTQRQLIDYNGNTTFTQGVVTSGSPTGLLFTGGAHTTLAANTEAIDVNFNLARTVQFTSGALTTQRATVFQAPTYAFTGTSTLTNAATVAITGAPVAGTNATLTNSYSLWVQNGNVQIDGSGATGLTVSVDSIGRVTLASNVANTGFLKLYAANGTSVYIGVNNNAYWRASTTAFYGVSNGTIGWANTTAVEGVPIDTGLARFAAAVVKVTDGSTGNGWLQREGIKRLTADVTATGTTLVSLSDLSVNVIASGKYVGVLIVKCNNSVAAEGIRFDFNGGNATITSFWAAISAPTTSGTLSPDATAQIVTSISSPLKENTMTGETIIEINFSVVINAAGTFIPRFAKDSTGGGGTVTAELGSFMKMENSLN